MNSKTIEEYDFDNPNRITISASFGISSNRAKTISTTVDVPINKTQKLSKAVAIPIKKAKPITSLSTIISNLERLASSFGININEDQNLVELDNVTLRDIEKLLKFANDPIFSMEGSNLKEAYFKFENSDGTYTHKSFVVDTIKISDQTISNSDSNHIVTPETSLKKLLSVVLISLLTFFNNPEFRKIIKDINVAIFASFLYGYVVNPNIEKVKDNPNGEVDIFNIESLTKFFDDKRVITHTTDLVEAPKLKSSIIENLPPHTILTVIQDKSIPKSWLKVKITLDKNTVEGYVLRRYTAPIR